MISLNFRIKLSLILAIGSWLLITLTSWILIVSNHFEVSSGLSSDLPKFFYLLFFSFVYYFYRLSILRKPERKILEYLWRVFATGLITTAISLIVNFLVLLLSNNKFIFNPYISTFLYHSQIGLITIFLISTFIVWEKLVFYQKTKILVYTWRTFEYFLLASLMLTFLDLNMISWSSRILIGLVIMISIYFSFNLKWVAYLNFREKWKSILLNLLTLAYISYFTFTYFQFEPPGIQAALIDNYTLYFLSIFIFIYAAITILVLLFNLPTSSVFEKKIEEILNFQRLSQSYSTGKKVEEIYAILLESSSSAVSADAAWLEIETGHNPGPVRLTQNMDAFGIQEVKSYLERTKSKKLSGRNPFNSYQPNWILTNLKKYPYRSALIFPIVTKGTYLGTLGLLKDISDGFNEEMINMVRAFVDQATISYENFKMFDSVLENERYIRELNIARNVQKSLLPASLANSEVFDMVAFSRSADEVGGDYYDIYNFGNGKTAIMIADVSGKGTSAAFQMSQMKGIFNSLIQLDLEPDEFLVYVNNALSKGLDKRSFVTGALYIVDGPSKCIKYSLAGHCPGLFYTSETGTSSYFNETGLGLGIKRNHEFKNHVKIHRIDFQADDLLFLFTDGITDARNMRKEDFGYDRLKKLLTQHALKAPKEICDIIIKELFTFCDLKEPEDDYSMVILKFK